MAGATVACTGVCTSASGRGEEASHASERAARGVSLELLSLSRAVQYSASPPCTRTMDWSLDDHLARLQDQQPLDLASPLNLDLLDQHDLHLALNRKPLPWLLAALGTLLTLTHDPPTQNSSTTSRQTRQPSLNNPPLTRSPRSSSESLSPLCLESPLNLHSLSHTQGRTTPPRPRPLETPRRPHLESVPSLLPTPPTHTPSLTLSHHRLLLAPRPRPPQRHQPDRPHLVPRAPPGSRGPCPLCHVEHPRRREGRPGPGRARRRRGRREGEKGERALSGCGAGDREGGAAASPCARHPAFSVRELKVHGDSRARGRRCASALCERTRAGGRDRGHRGSLRPPPAQAADHTLELTS